MARPHRLRIVGLTHHITQRGNNRMDMFLSEEDRELFYALLCHACPRHGVDVHGYVLMRNHVHLLVTPRTKTAIEKAMQSIGVRYAHYFNRCYRRTGTLFEGRYRRTIVDTDLYWLSCLRYIELNPVRAGIVSRPEEYYWSSYGANAFGAPDRLVSPHPLYLQLASGAADRQRCWRDICAGGIPAAELEHLRACVNRDRRSLGPIVLSDEDHEQI
jgi:putative transposase